VLCKFGIEYVDDPATGKKIPTCHRSSFDSIMEDSDFEQALENADVMARRVYREEAKQIEELRKEKFNTRAQAKAGQNENPVKMRTIRRNIARALTEQTLRANAKKA
jgi:ribosomal protein L29